MGLIKISHNKTALFIAKRRWLRRTELFDLPSQGLLPYKDRTFCIDLADWRGPSYHVNNWGLATYEKVNLTLALEVFPANGVFIDIGANIGMDLAPDFIKIDTEQHEKQVLVGAAGTLARTRPIVDMECFRKDLADLLTHFQNMNYRAYKAKSDIEFSVENEDWRRAFPEGSEHANVLFYPSEKQDQVLAAAQRAQKAIKGV